MGTIENIVDSGSHLVLESGTGTGKTICTLAPVLKYAVENDKRVLYCTRTNSQQRQVLYELRSIKRSLEKKGSNKFQDRCLGIGMQGRQNLCLLTKEDQELAQSSAEELSRLCSDRKNSQIALSQGQGSTIPGCKYFERLLKYDLLPVKKWIRNDIPTTEEIVEYCADNGICPYELLKKLLPESMLVVAPYMYIFNRFIRRRILDWFRCNFEDMILIIDEAHNLPDFARELGSMQLSRNTLKIAREEAIEFGDPAISDSMTASSFVNQLSDILHEFKNEYVVEEDGFVPPDELQVELMTRLSVISNKLKVMVKNLMIIGEVVRGKRRKMGRLPRSYLYSVGNFLDIWFELEADTHVKLIVDSDNTKLEAYCMDPSVITDVVQNCHATIHISGTLVPMEEYRDSIGLPDETLLRSFPSPFPTAHRKIIFADDVTTKFERLKTDEKVLVKIEEHIQTICNGTNRNTIVFFPSYKLLNELIHRGVHFRLNRKFYLEQQNMGQRRLMGLIEDFRADKGILFAVMGGRISEGMDFPGSDLELVVLVGIPYPRPTARHKALQNYYEKKFGKGWEYTVHAPATRKLLQSIGRLIRTETDRGVAVILDDRSIHFKKHLDGLSISNDINSSLVKFFQVPEMA
jgi:DNA excision repair protein ERCC-2